MAAVTKKAAGPKYDAIRTYDVDVAVHVELVDNVGERFEWDCEPGSATPRSEREELALEELVRQGVATVADGPDLELQVGDAAAAGSDPLQEAAAARSYEEQTVAELRDLLRGRDLSTTGTKAELIERLLDDDAEDDDAADDTAETEEDQ